MGCDISTLSNHNLDLCTIEALANDLANRLCFSVEYGYYSHSKYATLLGHETKDDFILLGTIEKKPFISKYRLTSCNYQQRLLFEKHGDALFQMSAYWNWYESTDEKPLPDPKSISEEEREIALANYDFEPLSVNGEYDYLTIYDEIVDIDFYYYSRWWTLCDTIQERDSFYHGHFDKFRLQKAKLTKLLGGDKLYYINDQSNFLEGVGQGSEAEFTWEGVQNHIQEKLGDCLISISKSLLDQRYQLNIKLLDYKKIGFLDDFEDIKDCL
ncbi:hypothetical protein [Flavobacterium sp. 7A]|uniref:hypothetical protein n=1 Tax=Flavobacterium sp. 7A TaxID=2940571 RepID=UPI0022268B83|nr:hypothetical protein [Flavobacterium sp. 7A]MCW2118197.1 hypothetical protein [Flavobacterium sp. 7A]